MSTLSPVDARVERSVLSALVRLGSADRDHLVAVTGLSKGVVSETLSDLLERNVVRPVGKGAKTRTAVIELNPGATHVVGVAIDDHEARATLADLWGTPLAERAIHLGAHRALDIAELCRALMDTAGVQVISGVVVSGQNRIDREAGGNLSSAGEFASELREQLQADVHIEHDALLAALGERWHGAARGFDDIALLMVGKRVGLGQIINGRPVRGAYGRAGDLGHLPLGPESTGRGHRRGSFELVASTSGMRLAMAAALERGGESSLSMASTARQILDAADRGDTLARRLVDIESDLLAKAVLSIVCSTDPAMIILAGEIGGHEVMLAPLRDICEAMLSHPVRIERSQLGEHAVMVGAVAVAVEKARHAMLGTPTK